jgi:transcriptional regulator with XRE-family HTH domain
MKKHHSSTLDQFLSLGNEAERARTQNRMMMAAKIYEAMKKKGIGKKKLSEMMGVSPSVVTRWLSGANNFRIDTLTDIERVLGVDLLGLGDKPVGAKTGPLPQPLS